MESKAVFVETKGYCLSCMKKANPGSELVDVSIQNAFDFLDLNTHKVFSDVLPVSRVSTSTNMKGKLCSSCEKLLGSMKEVKLEMERLEKKYDEYLKSLHGKVEGAEEKGFKKEMIASPNTTVHLGIVRQLRKELLSKCRALAKEGSVPEASAAAATSASRTQVAASQAVSQEQNSLATTLPLNAITVNKENEEEKKVGKGSKKQIFPQILPPHPTFMLSSLSQYETKHATKIIISLGGKVSSLKYFDLASHAVIMGRFSPTSEKLLGCLASGKFILRMDYLDKCQEQGKFLPINEDLIWKEENIQHEFEKGFANLGFNRLRSILEDEKRKPMFGKKVFFHASNGEAKNDAYSLLVVAGGGQVVGSMEEATIVCAQDEKLSVPDGVELHKPKYLNNLIWDGPRNG